MTGVWNFQQLYRFAGLLFLGYVVAAEFGRYYVVLPTVNKPLPSFLGC